MTGRLRETYLKIYQHYYDSEKVELCLTQRDLDGFTVLERLSSLKLYEFLQITLFNRIANGLWNSKTDIGGSLFSQSTSYDLLFVNKLRFKEDREQKLRFYERR